MEKILVLIIVFVCIIGLIFRIIGMFKGKDSGCSCGDCNSKTCVNRKEGEKSEENN